MYWLEPVIGLRRTNNRLVDLRIASAPHMEKNDAEGVLNDLIAMRDRFTPVDDLDIHNREFDREKVEQLRSTLGKRKKTKAGEVIS